jgi:membrane-associated phospholipid phosphatase
MKILKLFVFFFLATTSIFGQYIVEDTLQKAKKKSFKYETLIIPTALISYGIIGIESDALKIFNSEIKEEINEHIDEKITIDDISQYTPFLTVYALNAMGIEGKNNFKDRTIVLGTAYLIMGISANGLKHATSVLRPDGTSNNSFPSGHTATAFMGAEFLYQEYKDISIWYGISGYLVATGTGFFRIYNDRHWLTDVATGAGIGILSTKIAYWIHPFIKRKIFKNKESAYGVVMPFYNGREYGLGMALKF